MAQSQYWICRVSLESHSSKSDDNHSEKNALYALADLKNRHESMGMLMVLLPRYPSTFCFKEIEKSSIFMSSYDGVTAKTNRSLEIYLTGDMKQLTPLLAFIPMIEVQTSYIIYVYCAP